MAFDNASGSQPIRKNDSNRSRPQENPLEVKHPGWTSPDIPLTATEVILGGPPAQSQFSNSDLQSNDEKSVLQGIYELNLLTSEGATKGRSITTRIHHAWMKIHRPGVDPNFSHLPRGLNKRIDPNKDPLRDKLRRLRRHKKKSTRPVRRDELPQQYPEPIYWPAPSAKRDAPRQAPPVRPHIVFENTGPAFDDYRNPLGGEQSVLYEREEGRERRNHATQLALRDRSVSDRFLGLHGQRHLRNSLIGRAPPISRHYIQKEVQRRVLKPNKKAQEEAQEEGQEEEARVSPGPPGPARIARSPRTPSSFGLPTHGARGFQWDRAILPSKSVPDFRARENKAEDYLHSAPIVAGYFGSIGIPDDDRVTQYGSGCQNPGNHRDPSVSGSSPVNYQWVDEVRDAPGLPNVGAFDHDSVLHCIHGGNSESHTGLSSDNSSDYSKESDSDDGYYIGSVYQAEQSSEHLAEIYRREIETLDRNEPDRDSTVSDWCSLPETSSTALPPTPSDRTHSPITTHTTTSLNGGIGHVEVKPEAISKLAVGRTSQQMATPTLKSGGEEAKLIAPLLTSRDRDECVQGRRNPLKMPLRIEPLQANTRYYHQGNSWQTSRVLPSPFVGHALPQRGEPATNGSQHENDHTFGTMQGKPQAPNAPSVTSRQRNKEQRGYAKNKSMLQTAATRGALNHHFPRAPPRLPCQIQQVPSPPNQSHTAQIPRTRQHLHQHSQQRPQAPTFQAENQLSRPSQEYLRDHSILDGRTMNYGKAETQDHTPLAQDGPYPRMPGRNMVTVEELMWPTRSRAATIRSSSSQETYQERDKHHTFGGNGPSQSTTRPLGLPHRPRPVDSLGVGLGRPLAENPTAAVKRNYQR